MENEKWLIDANELMSNIHFYDEQQKNDVWRTSDIEALLAEQPTVDAVEVKHGRWNIDKSFMPFISTCSQCGATYTVDGAFDWNYCPQCGARMDLDNE